MGFKHFLKRDLQCHSPRHDVFLSDLHGIIVYELVAGVHER